MANNRGGLSKREFAAKNAGVATDYTKSAKNQAKAKPIVQPVAGKKVTYNMSTGQANVSSDQKSSDSYDYSQAKSMPSVYGPAIPAGFKSQMSAVKNYSDAKSVPKEIKSTTVNYSKPPVTESANYKKAVADAQRAKDESKKSSSASGIFKNTLSGIKDVFLPGRGYSDQQIAEAKPSIKEKGIGLVKSVGEVANLIPKSGGFLAKGVAKVAEKAGATNYAEKVRKTVDKYSEKSDAKLAPKTAGEAKVMRGADIGLNLVGGITTKSGVISKALGESINAAVKAGKSQSEIAAIFKAGEKGIASVGKAGLSKNFSDAGDAIRQSVRTPRASAAEISSTERNFSSVTDNVPRRTVQTDDALNVKRFTQKGEKPVGSDKQIDEAYQAPEKAAIERTKVARLNDRTDTLRAKIAKAMEDSKNQVDEINPDGTVKPKADPMDEVNKEIDDFKKEFEDLTGEKAPADPDELVARINSISQENRGKWIREDKTNTRKRELGSLAGVRKGTTYVRGAKRPAGGKFGGQKGILVQARANRVAQVRGQAAPINMEVKRVSENLLRHNPSITRTDAEAMARDVISGRDFSKDRRALNGVALKKDDGAIRQIASETKDGKPDLSRFERAKNLNPEDAKIEEAAFTKIHKKEVEILTDYTAKNGKVVNADSFRPYFKKEGYAGHNAASVQEPSSYLAKRAYTEGLKNDGEFATIYAGGSGTGKTSAIKGIDELSDTINKSSVVLDGNLSSYNSAIKKIAEARDAGKKTPIYYVYRDPSESFEQGVVKRMINNKSEMGRLVPSDVVAGNHIDSWEVVKRLHSEGYDVHFIDNSLGHGKAKPVNFEDLNKKISYPGQAKLADRFNTKAESLFRRGEISEAQYTGYTGKKPPVISNPGNVLKQPWWKEKSTSIREVIQDNWIRVKKLQENPDVFVDPNKLTPYEAETLFHGRVGTRITQANDTLKSLDKEIADLEKTMKNPEIRKNIDEYLVAKHAPERNALHGESAAGMTTQEANDIVAAFEGETKNAKAIEVAQKIKKTNEQTLDILKDSQVIDEKTYQTLRETYKEHIPLNRVMDETEDIGQALVSGGYDVRSTGIKRAKGSKREVADILTNVGANLEQAIVRAEKNRIDLATLDFARDNKNLGLFSEIKPKAIGQTFDGKPLLEQINDPLVLTVRENGKPVYLRINDERMATIFKGIGNEKLPPVLNFISGFTRLYSGLATRFNPEFVLSNKLRDLQEMAVFMSSQKEIGFTGAGKTMLRDPASMKDVIAQMRGKDTPGARLYKQMMDDGGTTGGQALSTRKQLEIDIEDMRRLNRGGVLNMRTQGKKLIDAFDSWNQIFEDSTRLSVYKSALDKGLSREKAAILAKNSTINFNKKGTGGPVINGLYMFANASIQGTTKLLTAMKNPKTAAAVTTAVGGAVWSANSWNDKVDPDWRDKVSKWDRDSNLVVMLPGDTGVKYLTIPVSWGLKPMKVMADYAYDASNGHTDDQSGYAIAGNVLSSVWSAYNPVGGTDITSAAIPSFLDIPVEIARNQKWSGTAMRPEDKAGVPASEAFFQNKQGVSSDKSTSFDLLRKGTAAIAGATGGNVQINPANLKYALDGYLSGAGNSFKGAFETVSAISGGELPQAADTPFSRRFYKNKTEEEIAKAQKYDAKDTLYATLKSTSKGEQGPVIQEYLNTLPADQRKGAAYGLMQEGFNTKGTTSSDDVIRFKEMVNQVNELEDAGQYDEVDKIIEDLSPEDLASFKNASKSVKSKATRDLKESLTPKLTPVVDQIIALEDAGKYDESDAIFNGLSDDEQKVVQSLIKNK